MMEMRRFFILTLCLTLMLSVNGEQVTIGQTIPMPTMFIDSVANIVNEIQSAKPGEMANATADKLNNLLTIYAEQYGVKSIAYADCLMWCARKMIDWGDLAQGDDAMRKSSFLFKLCGTGPFQGRDTIQQIFYLDCIAIIEEINGRDAMVLYTRKQSARLKREVFGDQNEIYLNAMLDLSKTYADRLYYQKSNKCHNEVYPTYIELLRHEFTTKSEAERQIYWGKASRYIQRTTDIADNYAKKNRAIPSESLSCAAYNALLLSKGILLNTTIGFDNYVRSSGLPEAVDLLKKKKIAVNNGASIAVLDSFDYAIMDILKINGKQYEIDNLSLTWEDVAKALGSDDLAIEFYHSTDGEYGALLLKHGWKSPKTIHLNDMIRHGLRSQSLDRELAFNFYDIEHNDKPTLWKISKSIWCKDIIKYFPKTPNGKVYFSAAGQLLATGIEYFPFINIGDSYLTISDVYNIYRVSSTRQVVLQNTEQKGENAAIYGGLSYNMSVSAIAEDMKHYSMNERIRGGDISPTLRYAEREIEPLDGTRIEADSIISLINEQKKDNLYAIDYTGTKGTEASFKSLSGKETQIIHMATHGFYLPKADSISYASYNPLQNCGLLLAGVQRTIWGEMSPIEIEDGILTAQEISAMDLRGTSLVVLSACETGKGTISSDGVFGLQRGLKMASVNSILMSLWNVDDETTKMLMIEFYKEWLQGKSLHDALQFARKRVREYKNDSYYWAPFILLDGLD